ncbi:MAG: C10 family peptidase [Bacteroidales bacterium]|nr:C10 family peptidase [Bacteroidales bacterium]MBR0117088.1 C10 family peptidase [Prevotella sp.]
MKLTSEQALARILATKGASGATERMKAAKKPPVLTKTLRNKLFVFDNYGTTIIAPNRDDLPPILAEYDSGKETTELKWWLNEYADEMAAAVGEEKVIAKAPAKAAAAINIEPLLGDIVWGQKAPFWNNLKFPHPTKAGARCYCVTGCAPLAIGMVLYHFSKKGYRRGCLATKEYTTTKYKYSVTAMPSMPMFDWASMTDGKPTTTKGKAAVAVLMEYCGRVVRADYGYSSTSAPMANVAPALRDYFGLGDARRLQNMSNAALKAEIIAELQKGNPVIMCGTGNNSSGKSECHCFVCDGYRSSDDMLHFNFGWDGDGNGWFKFTALNPTTHNFSSSKNAIVGLVPTILGDVNGDGKINMADVTKIVNVANSREYERAADINSDGRVDDKEDANAIINKVLGKDIEGGN